MLEAFAPVSLASAQPVEAAGDDIDACVVAERFEWGYASITRNRYNPDAFFLKAAFLEDMEGRDGSRSSLRIFANIPHNAAPSNLDSQVDSWAVVLSVGNAQLVDGPTLVYFTRDNSIPFDVAPAKLVYPRYLRENDRLEIGVSMGDLERDMTYGPGS